MPEGSKGGTEVLVNFYRLICREKVGGSQRIPLLTKKIERINMNLKYASLRKWSDEQIKLIEKLHEKEKLSFSTIAERFNTTKNSIIGAYWRYRKKKGKDTTLYSKYYEPPPGFITRKQLKEILGVSMGTIANRVKELPHVKLGKKRNCRILFNEAVIFDYIEQKYGNDVLKKMKKKG